MPHSRARRLAWVSAAGSAGRRWRSYLALAGCVAAAVAAIAAFPEIPLRQGYTGLVLGTVGALIAIGMIGTDTPARDGRLAAPWHLDSVRRLRGWHVSDNLPFERGAVDHVVVAPSAVLAVETTYRAGAHPRSRADAERHQHDLRATVRAAATVRQFLTAEQPGHPAVVVPVLMVHGPGAPSLPTGHCTEGEVLVVNGTHPDRWTQLFTAPTLDTLTRCDLYVRIERVARHNAQPSPPVRQQMWHEFRGGIAHERAHRSAQQRQVVLRRRQHRAQLVSVPAATDGPAAAPGGLAAPAAG